MRGRRDWAISPGLVRKVGATKSPSPDPEAHFQPQLFLPLPPPTFLLMSADVPKTHSVQQAQSPLAFSATLCWQGGPSQVLVGSGRWLGLSVSQCPHLPGNMVP